MAGIVAQSLRRAQSVLTWAAPFAEPSGVQSGERKLLDNRSRLWHNAKVTAGSSMGQRDTSAVSGGNSFKWQLFQVASGELMTRSILEAISATFLFAATAAAANIMVPVSEDAALFFRSDNLNLAATNFGSFYNLYAGSFEPSASSYSRSVLKFNLPPLAPGQTVESAKFRLIAGQEFPQLKTYDFYHVDDNWTEGTVTWLRRRSPRHSNCRSQRSSIRSAYRRCRRRRLYST